MIETRAVISAATPIKEDQSMQDNQAHEENNSDEEEKFD
jgi:hypothetical protein